MRRAVSRGLGLGGRREWDLRAAEAGEAARQRGAEESEVAAASAAAENALCRVLTAAGPHDQAAPSNPYSESYSLGGPLTEGPRAGPNAAGPGLEKREWQVSFSILEGRLRGAALNPSVAVAVGAQRTQTSVKHDTQNPEWNEVPPCLSHPYNSVPAAAIAVRRFRLQDGTMRLSGPADYDQGHN